MRWSRSSATSQSAPTPRQSHWKRPSHPSSASSSSSGVSFWFSPSVRRSAWQIAGGLVAEQHVGRGEPAADGGAAAGLELASRVLGLGARAGGRGLEPGEGVDLACVVGAGDHREAHAVADAVDRRARRDDRGLDLGAREFHRTRDVDDHDLGGGGSGDDVVGPRRGDCDQGVDVRGPACEELVLVGVGGELGHVRPPRWTWSPSTERRRRRPR